MRPQRQENKRFSAKYPQNVCGALAHFDLAVLYQVEIRRRRMLVKCYVRDNLEAINDLSVDV